MGFDRREPPGAPLPVTPGAAARAPGKQTLLETEFGGARMQAAPARGRQTVTPPAGDTSAGGTGPAEPVQQKARPDGATEPGPPPSGNGGTPLPPEVRRRMEAALLAD